MWWTVPMVAVLAVGLWGRWLIADPRRYAAAVAGLPSHPWVHRATAVVVARRLRRHVPVRVDARAISWLVGRAGRTAAVSRMWALGNRAAYLSARHVVARRRRTRLAMGAIAVTGRVLAVASLSRDRQDGRLRSASPGRGPGRRRASTAS